MHPTPPSQPAAPSEFTNPADIAREAFRRLASRRIAPTPDAYRDVYNEVAGVTPPPSSEGAVQLLNTLALRLADMPGDLSEYGVRFRRAVKERDWEGYSKQLAHLIDTHLRKGGALERLGIELPEARALREMLGRALGFALPALLAAAPELAAESESLGTALRVPATETELAEMATRFKQLCYKIELYSGDMGEQQELLLRLFRLLLDNVSELLDDDSWMRGQIANVQDLIAGPIHHRALDDAARSLKDVIYRQGKLKHGLSEVKLTVKNMMMTFVDKLGSVAASTGDFQASMAGYVEQISHASNIGELNDVLSEVVRAARQVEQHALDSRDSMLAAHGEVQAAEARIAALEAELAQMSELVREDHLTGSLNRRGLDHAFERERARAERRATPLCVALLDLDNFKRLNDTHGHAAGDAALRHLVQVMKQTLRAIDSVARYGGEEFVILMPDTPVADAVSAMVRVQRELTRHFFLHENEKLLITFSAGVALHQPGEDQAHLFERADKAMYQAKRSGKNRVVIAE
ncbi:MAG: GGDEF domain-containing protein [Telluria sp.]